MNCMFSKIFTFLKCTLIAVYMEQCTEKITQSLSQDNRANVCSKIVILYLLF